MFLYREESKFVVCVGKGERERDVWFRIDFVSERGNFCGGGMLLLIYKVVNF